MHGPMNVIVEE